MKITKTKLKTKENLSSAALNEIREFNAALRFIVSSGYANIKFLDKLTSEEALRICFQEIETLRQTYLQVISSSKSPAPKKKKVAKKAVKKTTKKVAKKVAKKKAVKKTTKKK